MKELSIEEKAKRYDEAIKFAKIYHNSGDEDMKTMCETIFPELKESEDDRIRKHLISLVKNWDKDGIFSKYTSNPNDIKQILAWLEKQGEQKTDKDMIEALRTEYEKGRADVIADTLSWLANVWPQYCSNPNIIDAYKEGVVKD